MIVELEFDQRRGNVDFLAEVAAGLVSAKERLLRKCGVQLENVAVYGPLHKQRKGKGVFLYRLALVDERKPAFSPGDVWKMKATPAVGM